MHAHVHTHTPVCEIADAYRSSLAPARLGARCPNATDNEALTEGGRLLPSSTPRRSGPPWPALPCVRVCECV